MGSGTMITASKYTGCLTWEISKMGQLGGLNRRHVERTKFELSGG
jgi:hypothetical protein